MASVPTPLATVKSCLLSLSLGTNRYNCEDFKVRQELGFRRKNLRSYGSDVGGQIDELAARAFKSFEK